MCKKSKLDDFKKAIDTVEIIRINYDLDIDESCKFFYSLYRLSSEFSSKEYLPELDNIIVWLEKLPLHPKDVAQIIIKSRPLFKKHNLTLNQYFKKLQEAASEEFDVESIFLVLKTKFDTTEV